MPAPTKVVGPADATTNHHVGYDGLMTDPLGVSARLCLKVVIEELSLYGKSMMKLN